MQQSQRSGREGLAIATASRHEKRMSEERQNEEHRNRVRLDQLLLNTGLVASRARARDAIQRGTVKVDGRTVDLTPSEFDMLAVLMSAPGRVFSRADLLERLQGGAYEGVERTIDVHIRNLRAKIEPDPADPRYVQTVFGVGYRFAADGG